MIVNQSDTNFQKVLVGPQKGETRTRSRGTQYFVGTTLSTTEKWFFHGKDQKRRREEERRFSYRTDGVDPYKPQHLCIGTKQDL